MKILVVSQYYYPENFTITRICEELSKLGHQVTVLTGKPNYGYGYILPKYKKISKEIINNVEINRVNLLARKKSRLSTIFNYLSFWRNSKKWVKRCKEEYDIVYSMSLSPVTILAAGNLYKKKHGVKHIVHCVDLWPESPVVTNAVRRNSLMYKILYKWSRKLYSNADKILIGSPSYKDYFKNVLKLNVDNIEFLPQPSLIEDTNMKPFILDKNVINVTYCGNIGTIQNIEVLPEIFKDLVDLPIRLNIIGMGPKSSILNKKIKEFGLQNKIIYYGPLRAKKASSYLIASDYLYISLSNCGVVGKTIPNKLIMYMAFGKPIIGTIAGDGLDILNEAKGAIICEENKSSIKELFKKIINITDEEKKTMGNNNKKYFLEHFTLELITKKLEKILFEQIN